MDFIQSLDPSKLALVGTILSFIISPFSSPPYNLPLFLFSIYAQENTDAYLSLQSSTLLIGTSILCDVIWMSLNHQHGFIRFLTILLLLEKIPTVLAFALALRQRGGAQFGVAGLGIRGGDLSGPTVWSMPGGFTSGGRDGYQTVDDSNDRPNPSRQQTNSTSQSGAAQTQNGAYQTV